MGIGGSRVAVVFERENLGREGIGWSRAAEIYTATREGQPDEALEQPAVGIHRVTDEREVQVPERYCAPARRVGGVERLHFQ